MSKLEELINKLCPNGVEFKNLDKVCSVSTGNQLNKNKLLDDAKYPVINGGINPSGYWHEYNTDKDTITISQGGASAGFVNYMKKPFWAGAHCYVVKLEDESVNYRYLFYCLKSLENKLQQYQQGAGIPSISRKTIYENRIPVPPLEVQCEIVRILDNFTLLSAELSAELSARQKQYEYYSKELFNFNDDVEFISLESIADIGTGSSNTNEAVEDGQYPFYVRSQQVYYKNNYEYDDNSIITSGDGVGVGKIFHYTDGKYALHQRAYRINITNNKVNSKYFYYYMKSTFYDYIQKNAFNSSVTSIRRPMLNKYPVPILSLEKQNKIVNILEKFEKLCNDISEGLPAEIEARKKQYEYYRDKLLTFKELKS